MRNLLALVLIAVFGFPAVAPALALGQDASAGLPACCRRTGAHHCMLHGDMHPSSTPAFSQRCPHFPQSVTAPAQANTFAILVAPRILLADFSPLTAPQHAETARRIARERSRHKRGPPTELLQ